MKLERLDFKEITLGTQFDDIAKRKIFIPSHTRKEAPPPPPVFTEEQMLASEREGYKKGFVAGELEGRKQAENEQAEVNLALTAMGANFVQSIAPLFDYYRQMISAIQKDVPNVALAIAQKIAGNALEKNAETIISELASRCCETLINMPEITITTHESLADTLESTLQELASQLPMATHIAIIRDPDMPRHDCRIEWKNGSLERITTQLWGQVENSLKNMQAITVREMNEQMEQLQTQLLNNPPPPTTTGI